MTAVHPLNSMALRIVWEMLQPEDRNGDITGYMICYDRQTFSNGCPRSNVTGADVTSFNLTGLNEATDYYVGVKARTSAGFGPLGTLLKGTTLEDSKYHALRIHKFETYFITTGLLWSRVCYFD